MFVCVCECLYVCLYLTVCVHVCVFLYMYVCVYVMEEAGGRAKMGVADAGLTSWSLANFDDLKIAEELWERKVHELNGSMRNGVRASGFSSYCLSLCLADRQL